PQLESWMSRGLAWGQRRAECASRLVRQEPGPSRCRGIRSRERMDAKRFANPLPGDRKHLTCPRHRARRACAGSAAAHPDRQSEDTVMHSSSRVRSLAVLSPLAFALAATSAQASTHVNPHEREAGHMYKPSRAAAARIGAPANVADRHAEMLGLGADSGLRLLTSATDADGTRHFRYQQTFHGIPVFGEQVIVSENRDGSLRNLFGRKVEGLAGDLPSVKGRVPKAQALALARHAAFGNRAAALKIS